MPEDSKRHSRQTGVGGVKTPNMDNDQKGGCEFPALFSLVFLLSVSDPNIANI